MSIYRNLIRHEGNQALFSAVEMSVAAQVNGYPFHLHVEGVRGTGKTTILRAAKELLSPIVRIKDCPYNCDPQAPHCPQHRLLPPETIKQLGTETVPCPFLEVSHSAKIGTVIGSIDLEKLVDVKQAVAALLPGTIPQAHRGVVFIDEINRLADTCPELADVLLDCMGTKPGRVQIEETGLPTVDMAVSVSVWAASNPDEDPGALHQIRRQLADRFDCTLQMARPSQADTVCEILTGRNNATFGRGEEEPLLTGDLWKMEVGDDIKNTLARLYVKFGIESLRAIESLQASARLIALRAGRKKVELYDVRQAAPWVLAHRVDENTLSSILQYLEAPLDNKEAVQENSQPVSLPQQQTFWLKKVWRSLGKFFAWAKPALTSGPAMQGDGSTESSGADTGNAKQEFDAPPHSALPLCVLPKEKLVGVESQEKYEAKQ